MAPADPLPLARLLSAATQMAVRGLNATLAERGYPDLRPADGYALLALGEGGATASQLGARLGITKQAAAKIAARLEEAGYLVRADHPHDGRARLLQRSPRGEALLQDAAEVQRHIERDWARTIGAAHMADLRVALEAVLESSGEDRPLAGLW
ncbi:MarR family transcriptional regulator [Baekduia soli]|uniref:MarR family transcriptional regulator n=1 Tax=Baekduia soli TaxID=496014 RepID=A0A5B8U4D2_9ACTN|nr:MarR family transcriptional regulator [Baekduia soli]